MHRREEFLAIIDRSNLSDEDKVAAITLFDTSRQPKTQMKSGTPRRRFRFFQDQQH